MLVGTGNVTSNTLCVKILAPTAKLLSTPSVRTLIFAVTSPVPLCLICAENILATIFDATVLPFNMLSIYLLVGEPDTVNVAPELKPLRGDVNPACICLPKDIGYTDVSIFSFFPTISNVNNEEV